MVVRLTPLFTPFNMEMTTHTNIPAWEIHGQSCLMGYSPWSHKRVRKDLETNTTTKNLNKPLVYLNLQLQ